MNARVGGGGARPRPVRSDVAPPACDPGQRIEPRAWAPALLATVAVGGSASNAGKTLACERIVGAAVAAGIPVTALKVTRTHVGTCPRENDACGVCDDLLSPWEIVADDATLARPRKDTGRYVRAGADCVLWLLVQPAAVLEGVRAVLARVPPGHLLVAEGNSFADYVTADLTLLVLDDTGALKPSARVLRDRADLLVVRGGGSAAEAAVGHVPDPRNLTLPEDVGGAVLQRLGLLRESDRPLAGPRREG